LINGLKLDKKEL